MVLMMMFIIAITTGSNSINNSNEVNITVTIKILSLLQLMPGAIIDHESKIIGWRAWSDG